MDEVLRFPIEKALVIVRGNKVLKVDKFDYTLHPESKKLSPSKASAHVPEWFSKSDETERDFSSYAKSQNKQNKSNKPKTPKPKSANQPQESKYSDQNNSQKTDVSDDINNENISNTPDKSEEISNAVPETLNADSSAIYNEPDESTNKKYVRTDKKSIMSKMSNKGE
jgi:type IV secretion system protein VirD4